MYPCTRFTLTFKIVSCQVSESLSATNSGVNLADYSWPFIWHIWEEGLSTEKLLLCSWPEGKNVGHLLNCLIVQKGGPIHWSTVGSAISPTSHWLALSCLHMKTAAWESSHWAWTHTFLSALACWCDAVSRLPELLLWPSPLQPTLWWLLYWKPTKPFLL